MICVPEAHTHVGQCYRAGYEAGKADAAREAQPVEVGAYADAQQTIRDLRRQLAAHMQRHAKGKW